MQPDQVWISVTYISGSPFEMEAATKREKKRPHSFLLLYFFACILPAEGSTAPQGCNIILKGTEGR